MATYMGRRPSAATQPNKVLSWSSGNYLLGRGTSQPGRLGWTYGRVRCLRGRVLSLDVPDELPHTAGGLFSRWPLTSALALLRGRTTVIWVPMLFARLHGPLSSPCRNDARFPIQHQDARSGSHRHGAW